MSKEIYHETTEKHSLSIALNKYFKSVPEEVEVVKDENLTKEWRYSGCYIIAHFLNKGVTLHYSGVYFWGPEEHNSIITLFGKPEDVSEVEKIVLNELAKLKKTIILDMQHIN